MRARSFLDPQFNPGDDQAVVELPVGSWLLASRWMERRSWPRVIEKIDNDPRIFSLARFVRAEP